MAIKTKPRSQLTVLHMSHTHLYIFCLAIFSPQNCLLHHTFRHFITYIYAKQKIETESFSILTRKKIQARELALSLTIYIYNKYILVIFSPDALMFFGFVCGCKDDKSLGLVGVGYPGLTHSKDQVLPDTGLIVSKYFNVIIPEIFKN